MAPRFPFSPFPNGWFRVAYSAELPTRGVVPLHHFGKHLVLFRTEDGRPHVLDAFCPHLGAHLGYGGIVADGCIRCPLHGWQFDSLGRCVHVPYCHDTPLAGVHTWPVDEVNGMIMVYHHDRGEAPFWHVPQHPECVSPDWTPLRVIHRWRIRSHVQELNENGVDLSHYTVLHGQAFHSTLDDSIHAEGPQLTFRMSPQYRQKRLSMLLPQEATGSLEIRYYGLGCAAARVHIKSALDLRFLVSTLLTPVDGERIDLHLAFSLKRLKSHLLTRFLGAKIARESVRALQQDIPIMEHKAYWSVPVLCRGDGQIAKFRRWAGQFYPDVPRMAVAAEAGE